MTDADGACERLIGHPMSRTIAVTVSGPGTVYASLVPMNAHVPVCMATQPLSKHHREKHFRLDNVFGEA